MPEQYYAESAIDAYRCYYMSPEKAAVNVWNHSDPPDWYHAGRMKQ